MLGILLKSNGQYLTIMRDLPNNSIEIKHPLFSQFRYEILEEGAFNSRFTELIGTPVFGDVYLFSEHVQVVSHLGMFMDYLDILTGGHYEQI